MLAPEDIVARRVLPTLRAMLARELDARGLTEREVAQRMGLTQSAVSKYLRGRGRLEPAVAASQAFGALAVRLAEGLAGGGMSSFEAMAETMALVSKEEDRGLVCTLHEAEEPALRGLGCDLCLRPGASDMLAEQQALSDLRAGLRAIEGGRWFAPLIPSVGSNLARAKEGAASPLDVAAVPGRIFEMRGAVRVPAPPEFGASRHVAEVVLAAMQVFPELQAALNVRADRRTLEAARGLGWRLVEFDAAYEGRHARIAAALKGGRRAPRALYHAGAFGIEPIMYILGRDAREVAASAQALAGAEGEGASAGR